MRVLDNYEKYKQWEEYAKYDLETAKAMFDTGRNLYVAFMCQQAIEKLVKGIYILYKHEEPPRTHNIWMIFQSVFSEDENRKKIMSDDFDEKVKNYKSLFIRLLAYYVSERYPSYKDMINKEITEDVAAELLENTREAFVWVQSLNQFGK